MKFHIVITNNETGEVELDQHTDAILASIHDEGQTLAFTVSACNGVAYTETVAGLFNLLYRVEEEQPMLYSLAKALAKAKQKEKETEINE